MLVANTYMLRILYPVHIVLDCSEDIDSTEIQLAVHTVVKDLPITEARLADLQAATKLDSQLQRLRHKLIFY